MAFDRTGSARVREQIQDSLSRIETEKDVRILYACESGSRAWGFASTDSDYDVRFLYLRRTDWYLSINIEHKRDVIERPVAELLDVNGWDLRKALKLFRKSNPPLLEWLKSPIVYRDEGAVAERLRQFLPDYYSPTASMYHYLHMARGNFRDHLRGEQVWLKKYFYVLRPILAIRWIERETTSAPTEFGVLVENVVDSAALKDEIEKLLEAKRAGEELDRGPWIPLISEFIESELTRLEEQAVRFGKPKAPLDRLNELFRAVLQETWQE